MKHLNKTHSHQFTVANKEHFYIMFSPFTKVVLGTFCKNQEYDLEQYGIHLFNSFFILFIYII
jgi:hypothetical protein